MQNALDPNTLVIDGKENDVGAVSARAQSWSQFRPLEVAER